MKKFGKWLKRTFIPHEENGHRPTVLHAKTVVPIVIAVIFIQAVFFFGSSYLVPRSQLFGLVEVNALTDGTNAARAGDGLPTLAVNSLLQQAAQEKANDMVTHEYFAHTSPSGTTPWHWFQDVGYKFTYAGENLAVNFSESQDVTDAWLNSPGHRANIMDSHFTQIGIAIAQGSFDGRPATYIVELFGAPAAVVPAPTPIVLQPSSRPTPVAVALVTPKPVVTHVAITTSTHESTGSEEMFVAIKGAEIAAVAQATDTPATSTVKSTSSARAVGSIQLPPIKTGEAASTVPAASASLLQRILANPAHTMNYVYLFLLFFFVVALGLNIFVKVRVQHPDLILGGLVAISVASVFIIMNQHYFLGAVIR